MTIGGAARFVGARVLRREDQRMLTGRGQYVDDIVVPGMLHVAFVRSDVARARIRGLDVRRARALDGVYAVLTADDVENVPQAYWQTVMGPAAGYPPFRALADGDTRYVGEPLAMVVADSRYIAEDGCDLVGVDYEPLAPVVDMEAATAGTAPCVHAELSTNVATEVATPLDPRIDAIFESAAHVVQETFFQHRYLPVPMETRGIVARWDSGSGELRVWASTQNPHELRSFFARALGLAEHQVRVTMGDVGGGFGQKAFAMREEVCVVLATHALGRPVKWIEDRRENLHAGSSARIERAHVKMAVAEDGMIHAVSVDHLEDVGAYPVPSTGASGGPIMLMFTGPYRIPKLRVRSTAVYTNTVGRAPYRGPWMMETTAREMMMDVAARRVGLDPLEFRRRNVIRRADLPYSTASGAVYDLVTPHETLEQAAGMLEYASFRREQRTARADGRHLGVGVSVSVEPTAAGFGIMSQEVATVRIDGDGRVQVVMGTASHGQGLETTITQVVADHLGVDLDMIGFLQGDTAIVPFNTGTGGSRSAVYSSGAARGAAEKVRDKLTQIAAHALEAAPEDLRIEHGTVSVVGTPSRAMTFGDLAGLAYVTTGGLPPGMEPGLEATVRFQGPAFTWSNSAHVCTVEVDVFTGRITLLRYIVSEDCGVMINPMVVEGQIDGGVVQGIGGALLEHMVYDPAGNPLSTTFLDYLLPTAADVPAIEHGHIETPAPGNAGGHKGMGEGGAISSPSAVANAVADALAPFGVQVTRQPLHPEEIFRLLGAGTSTNEFGQSSRRRG